MAVKELQYYISLADKAVAGFKRIDSNSERSSMGKMLSNSISYCRERKSQDAANFIVVLS